MKDRYKSISLTLLNVVIDFRKDRVKIASGSEHQVEAFSDRLVERILFSTATIMRYTKNRLNIETKQPNKC